MQGQRYWIECAFEDAKGCCGMADYQVRSWKGWHAHMAMVMMAMSFMLDEKFINEDDHPLLSANDIMILLMKMLPRKNNTVDDVYKQMVERHERRKDVIESKKRAVKRTSKIMT